MAVVNAKRQHFDTFCDALCRALFEPRPFLLNQGSIAHQLVLVLTEQPRRRHRIAGILEPVEQLQSPDAVPRRSRAAGGTTAAAEDVGPDAETGQADAAEPAGRSRGRCRAGTPPGRAPRGPATAALAASRRPPAWAAARRGRAIGENRALTPTRTATARSVRSGLPPRQGLLASTGPAGHRRPRPRSESFETRPPRPIRRRRRGFVDAASTARSETGSG